MNEKRPNYLLRIVACVLLLLIAQAVAGYAVVLLHAGGLIRQNLSLEQLDAKLLELMMAYQTEILLVSYGIILLVLLLVARRRKAKTLDYLSLKPPAPPAVCVLALGAGVAAAFWFGLAVNMFPWPADWMDTYTTEAASLTTMMPVLDVLAVALVGPLVEEILFRGLIYRYLCCVIPAGAAVVLQGVLFGGVHSALIWMLYAGLVGCILGYVRKRTGSLWPCVLMHMAFNGSSYLFDPFITAYGDDSTALLVTLLASAFFFILMLYGINFRTQQPETKE